MSKETDRSAMLYAIIAANNKATNQPKETEFLERVLNECIEKYNDPIDFAIRCAYANLANNIDSENAQSKILQLLVSNLKTRPRTLYESHKLDHILANITKKLEAQSQNNDPINMRAISLLGSAYSFAGIPYPNSYIKLAKKVGLQPEERRQSNKSPVPSLS